MCIQKKNLKFALYVAVIVLVSTMWDLLLFFFIHANGKAPHLTPEYRFSAVSGIWSTLLQVMMWVFIGFSFPGWNPTFTFSRRTCPWATGGRGGPEWDPQPLPERREWSTYSDWIWSGGRSKNLSKSWPLLHIAVWIWCSKGQRLWNMVQIKDQYLCMQFRYCIKKINKKNDHQWQQKEIASCLYCGWRLCWGVIPLANGWLSNYM